MLSTVLHLSRRINPAQCARHFSPWSHVEMGPKDPILGVSEAFQADPDPIKMNLGVGAYRDDQGKPWVLPSVVAAEQQVMQQPGYNHEYAPIGGSPKFCKASRELAFGADAPNLDNIVSLQSLSGTGSLCVLANYIHSHWGQVEKPTVYIPNPTWGNHPKIFNLAGLATETYRYYKPSTCGLDFEGFADDINNLPQNSVLLLHAAAHNPTGVDPRPDQWDELCDIVKRKGILVLFDSAYQGFASGDIEADAYGLRKFYSEGVPLVLAQSFAKNFGLYGQRVGAVHIVTSNADEKARVESQVKISARSIYSNPPLHGSRIVETVLTDPQLRQQWLDDVKTMAGRIQQMRSLLYDGVIGAGSTRNWEHIKDQIGMFCFSGLNPEQVDRLTNEFHIYMTKNGRISMAGVTSQNVQRLAESMHEVSK